MNTHTAADHILTNNRLRRLLIYLSPLFCRENIVADDHSGRILPAFRAKHALQKAARCSNRQGGTHKQHSYDCRNQNRSINRTCFFVHRSVRVVRAFVIKLFHSQLLDPGRIEKAVLLLFDDYFIAVIKDFSNSLIQ